MTDFLTNELFLYLALGCVVVAFALYIRSRRRRKKILERRRLLNQETPNAKERNKIV